MNCPNCGEMFDVRPIGSRKAVGALVQRVRDAPLQARRENRMRNAGSRQAVGRGAAAEGSRVEGN